MYNSQYYTCEQIDERLLQGYLDDYNTQTGQSLTKAQFLTKLGSIFSKEGVIDNTATQIGYYECDTAAGTAAKTITVANYALFAGGSMKVKFANKNTANNATLNINSQGAKALYYQGERASATNSWDANEVVEIYYDGTSYYANNVKGGSGSGVYDVSKEHPTAGPNSDGKFTLEYILNSSNVNELIPVNKRYPGMTIQFVSTSDNKYVQYRLMLSTFTAAQFTNAANWQGLDDVPTAGSQNLVTSGGVYEGIIYDISARNGGASYVDLETALAAIPSSDRRGGMVVRFKNSSTSKYEQYRYPYYSLSAFYSPKYWVGIDQEPLQSSENLVESGGVYRYVPFVPHYRSEFNTKGYLQATDGEINSNSAWKTSEYFNVKEGQIVEFKLHNLNDAVAIVFYDENKEKFSYSSYPSYTVGYRPVPPGAAYVRCSARANQESDQYIKIVDKAVLNIIQAEQDIDNLNSIIDSCFYEIDVSDGVDISDVTSPSEAQGTSYVFFRKDKQGAKVKSISAIKHSTLALKFVRVTVDANNIGSYEEIGTVPSGSGTYTLDFEEPIGLNSNQYIGVIGFVYKNIGTSAPDNYYFSVPSGEITYQEHGNNKVGLYSVTYIDYKTGTLETITPCFDAVTVYSVCNDIQSSEGNSLNSRNYSSKIYLDHFYKDLNKRPNIHIEGKKNFYPIYSLYELGYNTSYINNNVIDVPLDVYTHNELLKIVGDNVTEESLTLNHISVRNKVTENAHVRLLCIGDSVTAGANAASNKPYANAPETYWEWVKALFEMDKIENGNAGFDCELLGNYLSLPQDVHGRSNWITYEKKTFDIDFNGITKNGVSACAVAKAGAKVEWFLENSNGNVFWDSTNEKFSLLSWLSKYRTLIVNQDGSTTRCDDSNKGTLVTDVNAYNVCEPTHVLIAFGYNQLYNSTGTKRNKYLSDLATMIQTIKAEIPNVVILLQLPDTAGTYFPELFYNYMQESDDLYSMDYTKGIAKEVHDEIAYMNKDLMELEDVSNNIFYVPSYFVSPLCDGASYRRADDIGYLSSENTKFKQMVEGGSNGPQLHPNNTAHACWAYQIYSLIKYTLTLE